MRGFQGVEGIKGAKGVAMATTRLLGLVMTFAVAGLAAAGDGSVIALSGGRLTLSLGAADGVREGMTGRVLAPYTVGGKTTVEEIATFRVTSVRQHDCDAERTGGNISLAPGQEARFDQPLPVRTLTAIPAGSRATPTRSPPADPRQLDARCEAASREARWEDAEAVCGALVDQVPADLVARQRLDAARVALAEIRASSERKRALAASNADYLVDKGNSLAAAAEWGVAAWYYGQVAAIDPGYRDAALLQTLAVAESCLAADDLEGAMEQWRRLDGLAIPQTLRGRVEALRRRVFPLPEGFQPVPNIDPLNFSLSDLQRREAARRHHAPLARDARVGAVWAYIPSGTFLMGCVPADPKCLPNEQPRHEVKLTRDYWLMTTEVSVAQYRSFTKATGRRPLSPAGIPQNDDEPVLRGSWADGAAYCAWVGGRLPTEAEWERAARGTLADAVYPWGQGIGHATANWGNIVCKRSVSCLDIWPGAAPVVSLEPNGFGLYHMAGNVSEWCADWLDEAYYRSSPSVDPTGPPSGTLRVFRGGAWDSGDRELTCSARDGAEPSASGDNVGFRCAGDGG